VLTRPFYSVEKAIFLNKSYVANLYIPVQLTDRSKKKMYLKWVFFGSLPLMTKHGHFILNGIPRVIVNQIVRSPGVYFHQKNIEIYTSKWNEKPEATSQRSYADIICLRGTWLRLEVDREKCLWAQIKKGPKIPLLWLLLALGLPEKFIFKNLDDPDKLLKNFQLTSKNRSKKIYPYVSTTMEAWKELYFLINPLRTEKNIQIKKAIHGGRKWLFKKFINPKTYDLGKQGRQALQKKLNLSICSDQRTLTALDLLAITRHLLKVEQKFKAVDDIDHLKNKKLRASGDLLQMQFANGLLRIEKILKEKLNRLPSFLSNPNQNPYPNSREESNLSNFSTKSFSTSSKKKNLTSLNLKSNRLSEIRDFSEKISIFEFNQWSKNSYSNLWEGEENTFDLSSLFYTKPLQGALREFFGSHPLSQFMDQMNPLAEMTHKRRLSSMGPGGVTRDTATLEIRGIHPTHYGRICPIETPEGKNTGLVNSLTTYAKTTDEGLLKTPFYKVYKGVVQKKIGMIFLSAEQEEISKVATADLKLSKASFLPKEAVPSRKGKHFLTLSRTQIHYMGVSPLQMVSLATSLIPFLEHDDANRALMGSNMQRQAVPILRPERPLIGTGFEARVISDSGHAILSEKSGFVYYVSGEQIRMYCL
jgi:DNA-directed RNA polymerase subunit beta